MEEEQNETLDSLNEENGDDTTAIAEEEYSDTDTISEEDDASVLLEKNKRLFARAKKAEADLKTLKSKSAPVEKPLPVVDKSLSNEDIILKKVDERLEQRDLDSLELSDRLKQEVKSYAKLNNVSIKGAMDSSYIQFIKNEEDEKIRINEASISGSSHKGQAKRIFKEDIDPSQAFDLSTPEGRQEFSEWKKQYRERK